MNNPHKHAEFIKAFADGRDVEYYSESHKRWILVDDIVLFNLDIEFRIKPEPKLIPFDFSYAEQLIGKVVKGKDTGRVILITEVSPIGVVVESANITFDFFLEKYTFLDGSPCGKEQE